MTAKTQPDITQSVRAIISELIFVIIMGSAWACSDSIVASWASMARKLFSKNPSVLSKSAGARYRASARAQHQYA
ncbi:hypothetical protein NBY27_24760 (plasmid) [Escherichia coli]|uniref:hypothetical protein n=1 Tax=Escherichia coli TaxID=562 RepID=UPI00202EDFAE|nr:hypothetical protein [Escherichia coli]URU62227.1 hypothetical protein NBY27_24760 [Escherichia coli]